MALLQCERFFQENPGIEAVAVHDTAAAAQEVICGGRSDTAAIASLRAAEVYGGVVLAENLEDDPMNFTRFLLITRPEERPAGVNSDSRPLKTSLLFRVQNRPAALFEALRSFAIRGINMTKIESRPVRGSRFEYLFYLDAVAPPGREKTWMAPSRRSRTVRRTCAGSEPTRPPRRRRRSERLDLPPARAEERRASEGK